MQEFNQLRDAHGHWTSVNSTKAKLMRALKKGKRVVIKDNDGIAISIPFKAQEHGIKKALLERPFIADASLTLQRLVIEILHTTTEENVKQLILIAMKKIKWETELFTSQLERHIVEAGKEEKNDYRELTETERVKIKQRDGYACLCCGANTEIKLQISHIKPLSLGGEVSVENSQTLCFTCYKCQGDNEMDFRCNTTKLSIPENLDLSFRTESQYSIRTLTRIVNLFYRCKAVCKIKWEVHIYAYNIYLYPNNNPEWLLKHKAELLRFIQGKLGRDAYHVLITAIE